MVSPALADQVSSYLKRRARWTPLEIAFWIFAFATIWLFPSKYLIAECNPNDGTSVAESAKKVPLKIKCL